MPKIKFRQRWHNYIAFYRWPLVVVIGLFCSGLALGLVLPATFKLVLIDTVAEKFADILATATTDWELTWGIFSNNLTVAVILYGLGFSVILPVGVIVGNGMIIGIFLSLLFRADAIQPGIFITAVASLVPHGIFELSAFFLAGILSVMVTVKTFAHNLILPHTSRRRVLAESAMRFFAVIVPLLVVAALLEVYVSNTVGQKIGQWFDNDQMTAALAIPLNTTVLAEHSCTPAFEPVTAGTTATVTQSLSQIARVVYDDTTYQQLKQRSQIPYWYQYFFCGDQDYIVVQSWSGADWSAEQALSLQRDVFERSAITFTERKKDTAVHFMVENEGVTYTTVIMALPNTTVSFTTSLPSSLISTFVQQ